MDTKFYAGDIVLYAPTGNKDHIGKLIGFFTGGHTTDVSHSAMIISDSTVEICNKERVQLCDTVEMSTNIIRSKVSIKEWSKNKWDKAYIMRFQSRENFDSKKLVKSANRYAIANTKYDTSSIIFIAGLIIFKWSADKNLWRYCNNFLRYACKVLSDIIKEKMYGKDTIAVMCSQLVYQIYADCGSDYQIKIRNGELQDDSNKKARIINYISEEELLVADYSFDEKCGEGRPEEIGSIDHIINDLYQNLVEEKYFENKNEKLKTTKFDKCLAVNFLKQLKMVLKIENTNELESLFVTPYDLYANASNLQQIKEATIGINSNY